MEAKLVTENNEIVVDVKYKFAKNLQVNDKLEVRDRNYQNPSWFKGMVKHGRDADPINLKVLERNFEGDVLIINCVKV